MGHEIIRYRPDHKQEVADLLMEFWPDPIENTEYFSWLHEENPYSDCPTVYLLVDAGKVVGMRGFHGAKWEVVGSSESFDAPCACMFVIDKRFRGDGLAELIMNGAARDLAASGYQYVLSFSATPIPYMSQLRRGWQLVGNYRTFRHETSGVGSLRAIARRYPFLKTFWQNVGRRVPMPGQDTYAALDALLPLEMDCGILSVTKSANALAMAELAKTTAVRGLIRHVREPAYFAWRFRNPQMDYRFVYWHDQKLKGFLVLQKQRGNMPPVHIVDWEATNAEVLGKLFGSILSVGQFASLSIWSAALSEEMVSFLKERGFAQLDESRGIAGYSPGLQVKALIDDTSDRPWEVSRRCLHDITNWDLRPVYSDSF